MQLIVCPTAGSGTVQSCYDEWKFVHPMASPVGFLLLASDILYGRAHGSGVQIC